MCAPDDALQSFRKLGARRAPYFTFPNSGDRPRHLSQTTRILPIPDLVRSQFRRPIGTVAIRDPSLQAAVTVPKATSYLNDQADALAARYPGGRAASRRAAGSGIRAHEAPGGLRFRASYPSPG